MASIPDALRRDPEDVLFVLGFAGALVFGALGWVGAAAVSFALGIAGAMIADVLTPDGRAGRTADGDDAERTASERAGDPGAESVEDALDALRDRYARGEIDDETFERKLEALLETETPEDARDRVNRRRDADAGDAGRTGDAASDRPGSTAGDGDDPETERARE